ncbi:hypothetical protein B840_13125 (plasmid) [Corynebacterium marinum DSM 44953]|uniref:Transposase n=1 Tax=Corynebacterium marinum DSM 44953 TaxID=1224162 RepID=A0A0B6TQL2_9CORY|nr:hypothetical protein B840_13125 [Corynebacterium marinum DSM 44953]GGO22486.1 hypothetical protein GCM10010980_24640 [Corynebacterium marinum]
MSARPRVSTWLRRPTANNVRGTKFDNEQPQVIMEKIAAHVPKGQVAREDKVNRPPLYRMLEHE